MILMKMNGAVRGLHSLNFINAYNVFLVVVGNLKIIYRHHARMYQIFSPNKISFINYSFTVVKYSL